MAIETSLTQRTSLAGQVAIASELEAAALTPQTQGKISWFSWAVHVRESSSAHWVCSTYQPSETRTFLLLGQLAASGVAASLLHVAVNVFCEALATRIGATATPAQILQELNRFLWRPTRPIGMSCQVLVFDQEQRQVTYASAGDFDMLCLGARAPSTDGRALLRTQPPLGTAATSNFQSATVSLRAQERFLLWSPGVAGGGGATATLSRLDEKVRTLDAKELPAATAERVQRALGAGGSLLVVTVA
jgi:serine phosphatase RsbU (regulator of sigma subunit)